MKGSITLEASYIFPMTIIFIMIIMLFAYYKHDRIVARTSLRMHLIRNTYEEEKSDFMDENMPSLQYLSMSEIKEKYEKNMGKISATIKFDIFPKFLLFDERLEEGKILEEYKKYNPEEAARRYHMLLGE